MSEKLKKKTPAQQGQGLGNGSIPPPEEHQFKSGQSGNSKGSSKARTNLWKFINPFMEMTDAELDKVDRSKLTQAQQIALKLVENAKKGKGCDSERIGPILRRSRRGQGLRTPHHRQGQWPLRRRMRSDPGHVTDGI